LMDRQHRPLPVNIVDIDDVVDIDEQRPGQKLSAVRMRLRR